MTLLGYTTNEFGTMVSTHKCDACGKPFTVCPPGKEDGGWENCLAVNCPSYDIRRDMDLLFGGSSQQCRIQRKSIPQD